MIARFLLGAGLGGLVGTGILVIASILVPMAERPAPGGPQTTPEVAPVAPVEASPQETTSLDLPEVPAPEVTAQAPDAPAGTAPEGAAPDAPHAEAPAPDAAADPSGSAPAVVSGADAAPVPTDTPVEPPETRVEAVAPSAPEQPIEPESSAGVSPASEPSLLPGSGLVEGPDSPAVPAADLPPGSGIADAGLPPLSPEEEAMLAEIEENGLEAIPEELRPALVPGAETAPEAAPADSAEAPPAVTEAVPEPAVEVAPPAEPARRIVTGGGSTLVPSPGLAGRDSGNGRLPRIGDTPAPAGASDAPPLERYARPFDNAGGKPVFAIVLIDDGRADLDRAALADLPFPVSFALDPMDPAAADHARIYREAGQEVVVLATALPQGAVATDVEVAFDAMARALPEAVVVMDPPGRRFQADRALAALVVSVTGAQGRGLLTWEGGLNAAMQVALREDVPVAAAFRNLDAEDEAGAVVRRYLDRAAFKAAQVGRVTVVGRTRAETVEALLEWAVEGRAATVALAPVSAALAVD